MTAKKVFTKNAMMQLGLLAGPPPSGAAARPKRRAAAGETVSRKRSKFRNVGIRIDEIWWASKAQGARYLQLKELRDRGRISNLRWEVPYPIVVAGVHVTTYRADFVYRVDCGAEGLSDYEVVEDVKGLPTPDYKLKKKMMQAVHRISITEIPAKEINKWNYRTPPRPLT